MPCLGVPGFDTDVQVRDDSTGNTSGIGEQAYNECLHPCPVQAISQLVQQAVPNHVLHEPHQEGWAEIFRPASGREGRLFQLWPSWPLCRLHVQPCCMHSFGGAASFYQCSSQGCYGSFEKISSCGGVGTADQGNLTGHPGTSTRRPKSVTFCK
jgi:hypothetical protein